ncbi:MAG: hypothetical protein CMJ31_02400 [Phycisphaerae bacterium]|nr:hypothetical protein [Phycisphaerae bacterium]
MDPIRTYAYLTRARQRLFDAIRPLDAEVWTRSFDIGPGTLGETLTHVMISEWYYVQRMTRQPVPPYTEWPIQENEPPPFARLEVSWRRQAADTDSALAQISDWIEPFSYEVTDDAGRRMVVTSSPADQFTQLALHEVHHRAQALNMLRQLGVTLGDIDFNALMMPRRPA